MATWQKQSYKKSRKQSAKKSTSICTSALHASAERLRNRGVKVQWTEDVKAKDGSTLIEAGSVAWIKTKTETMLPDRKVQGVDWTKFIDKRSINAQSVSDSPDHFMTNQIRSYTYLAKVNPYDNSLLELSLEQVQSRLDLAYHEWWMFWCQSIWHRNGTDWVYLSSAHEKKERTLWYQYNWWVALETFRLGRVSQPPKPWSECFDVPKERRIRHHEAPTVQTTKVPVPSGNDEGYLAAVIKPTWSYSYCGNTFTGAQLLSMMAPWQLAQKVEMRNFRLMIPYGRTEEHPWQVSPAI